MADLGIYTGVALYTPSDVLKPAANASIEVREEAGVKPLASIFSDRDGNTAKSNPFTADSKGRFEFYAEELGQGYSVKVTDPDGGTHTLNNQKVMADIYSELGPVPMLYEPEVDLVFFDGYQPESPVTVVALDVFSKTAPTGSDLTIELLKDGAGTGQVATLTAGSQFEQTDITDVNFSTSERLGFKVTAIGSGEPANDVYVTAHLRAGN